MVCRLEQNGGCRSPSLSCLVSGEISSWPRSKAAHSPVNNKHTGLLVGEEGAEEPKVKQQHGTSLQLILYGMGPFGALHASGNTLVHRVQDTGYLLVMCMGPYGALHASHLGTARTPVLLRVSTRIFTSLSQLVWAHLELAILLEIR